MSHPVFIGISLITNEAPDLCTGPALSLALRPPRAHSVFCVSFRIQDRLLSPQQGLLPSLSSLLPRLPFRIAD